MNSRLPTIVVVILLILLFGGSLAVWGSLPDVIPTHFDVSGKPDSWEPRSLLTWLSMPLVAVGITALLYGIGIVMPRHPEWINLPDKAKFLAMTPERRSRVIDAIIGGLYWIGVMLNATFLMIQYATWRAAVGEGVPGLILIAVLLSILSSPFILITMLLRTQKLMA